MLAFALLPVLAKEGFDVCGIDVQEADITDKGSISKAILEIKPAMVVHTAAMTAVDACEDNEALAMSVNCHGASNVAEAAASAGAAILHISTDYVFNGQKDAPYEVDDPIDPVSVYGKSKACAERAVAEKNPMHYIVRTAWLYGANGKNFVDTIVRLGSEREELKVVSDQVGSPTYTAHLSRAIGAIVVAHVKSGNSDFGIYHATNSGRCSWHEFAGAILERVPNRVRNISPIDTDELFRIMNYKAPRPAFSVLSNRKISDTFGVALPRWEAGLEEYLSQR